MTLSLVELKTLFFAHFTNEQAWIISDHLVNRCFFVGEVFYSITPTISYEITLGSTNSQNKLLNMVSKLLQESFNKLSDVEKSELTSIKKWTSVLTNAHIKTYFPQLIDRLTTKQVLDDYFDEIHFLNGVYNLKDGSFKQREIGKHFITYHTNYDYEPPTKKQMGAMRKIVQKTFHLNEDYDCICMILGSALTGRGTMDQTMLFLLGDASSGKSNILSLTEASIQQYFVQLKDDAFAEGVRTADKVFNTFNGKLYIRVAWINVSLKVLILPTNLLMSLQPIPNCCGNTMLC
jgi:hypothetical protein